MHPNSAVATTRSDLGVIANEASAGGEATCACAEKLLLMCRFENSALTHSILIFEKNDADEKSLIFMSKIDI